MSREVPIVLVGTNDAMEAARLAMSIFAFGDPEARLDSLLVCLIEMWLNTNCMSLILFFFHELCAGF